MHSTHDALVCYLILPMCKIDEISNATYFKVSFGYNNIVLTKFNQLIRAMLHFFLVTFLKLVTSITTWTVDTASSDLKMNLIHN